MLIEDTARRYTFTPTRNEISEVWQAGYFNDRDRGFHATFDHYLDDMLPALRAGHPPSVPAAAGRRALELAHAIITSHETGTRVRTLPA